MTKANSILAFYNALEFDRSYLDEDLDVLNPFVGASPEQEAALRGFYHTFYNDNKPRNLILGINPGRLGAGATGIPFTDTKRLIECGIEVDLGGVGEGGTNTGSTRKATCSPTNGRYHPWVPEKLRVTTCSALWYHIVYCGWCWCVGLF